MTYEKFLELQQDYNIRVFDIEYQNFNSEDDARMFLLILKKNAIGINDAEKKELCEIEQRLKSKNFS